MRSRSLRVPLAALAAGAMIPVVTHSLGAEGAGFAAGLSHPVGGFDHLLAMVTVGLWAAQQGGGATLALPLTFLAAMVAGGALGQAGLHAPGVEITILASLVALGTLVALKLRLPLVVAAIVVAAAALAHGYAHGVEMPQAIAPSLYVAGFLLAAAILHAAGIAAVLVADRMLVQGDRLVQLAGGATALTGALLLAL